MTTAVLGQTPFAVVDVETTGLYSGQHDRIVEIAVVRLRPDLSIEEAWSTLINPRRDIGSTGIHGIVSGDVLYAPTFDEVVGDIADRLAGTVMAGHQLRFDLAFLAAEFRRCSVDLPPLPSLCMLDLAYRLLPE